MENIMKHQVASSIRGESHRRINTIRAGKLFPFNVIPATQNEAGIMRVDLTAILDGMAGRLLSPVNARVTSVFVPVEAMHAMKHGDVEKAGNREIIRTALTKGEVLFEMENENEISKACSVNPRVVGGERKINEVVRLAHNCAVNYLRSHAYSKASPVEASNSVVSGALLSSTIMQQFGGVLDPDERVDGEISFGLMGSKFPVHGVGIEVNSNDEDSDTDANTFVDASGETVERRGWFIGNNEQTRLFVDQKNSEGSDSERPDIYAQMDGNEGGSEVKLSLSDFHTASKIDGFVRALDNIRRAYPEQGDEMVLRYLHGLSFESHKHPFKIYDKTFRLGSAEKYASDGENLDTSITQVGGRLGFSTIIPKNELGGIAISFVEIKPDEAILNQPHPILGDQWGAVNYGYDEMMAELEPQGVKFSDIDNSAEDDVADQTAFYVGLNRLLKQHDEAGLGLLEDLTTVDNKNSIWQVDLPPAPSEENLIYPDDLSHYPFLDQEADVVTLQTAVFATLRTPILFGKNPIETNDTLDGLNVLDRDVTTRDSLSRTQPVNETETEE